MRGRFESKTSAHSAPGPGAYPITQPDKCKFQRAPNFVFGSGARDGNSGLGAPGPGQYSPFDPNESAPKFGFGTSTRGAISGRRSQTPGPGTYDQRSGLEGGPKYTAAPRRGNESRAPGVPGPGAYKPIDGAASEVAPKWGFGSSSRSGLTTLSGTPGPGTYNQESLLTGSATKASCPKYSMKPRRTDVHSINTPGPGAHGGAFTQFG